MIISEIIVKGFKSYGNNPQTLKLNTQKGELCLLVGKVGNGKSALINTFEYTLYGKCRGRSRKWALMSSLPNRINRELLTEIKFESKGVDVHVKRGINPDLLELYEDGLRNTKLTKPNLEKKIESYVGIDLETFNSFISLSVNDFKNFMALTPDEKQMLLNKLFNLEVIGMMNSILVDLNRFNREGMNQLDSEINTLVDSIDTIRRSIEKSVTNAEINNNQSIEDEIAQLRAEFSSKKSEYDILKSKVDFVNSKINSLEVEIESEKEVYSTVRHDVAKINSEIILYNSGKCPTCSSDFTDNHFEELKNILDLKLVKLTEVKSEIESNLGVLIAQRTKLNNISTGTNKSFSSLKFILTGYKNRINELVKKQKIQPEQLIDISEFEKSIIELNDRKEIRVVEFDNTSKRDKYYAELIKIFGDQGIRKTIISSIIGPLNQYVSENQIKMNLSFNIEIDNDFNVKLTHGYEKIDHDSLSTGESRLVNIAILVAYLKMVRGTKSINVLFLDEIFSAVDPECIEVILFLLKDFANSYNINIFVVHHAVLEREFFDRIIELRKATFTTMSEIQL